MKTCLCKVFLPLIITACMSVVGCGTGGEESSNGGKTKTPSYQYEITSFTSSWTKVSRGLTALEGLLWVPEIRMTIKNTGSKDIEAIYFRVMFLDAEGVIQGDDIIESVMSIPAGYAKGPVFIHGTLGYTSDLAFLPMMKDDSQKWRFDLFQGQSYSGPWEKIKSGVIDLPKAYERMK